MNCRRNAFVLVIVLATAAGCSRQQPPAQAWVALPLGTSASFRDVWFNDRQDGWIVGGSYQIPGGLVGRTRDSGKTWRLRSNFVAPSDTTQRFGATAVHFFDVDHGLVATDRGAIYATADGGENWARVHAGRGGADSLFGFAFVDDQRGWAVGTGGVLRTEDGGAHWSRMPNGADGRRVSGRAIAFVDERNGWLAGMHGVLMNTVDGGLTWNQVATPLKADQQPNLSSVDFVDARNGWIVGDEGTILATRDGGDTWTHQDSGVPDARSVPKPERLVRGNKVELIDIGDRTPGLTLTAVAFVDRSHGWITGYYAGIGRSLILHTIDGGVNWKVDANIDGVELRALFVRRGDALWAVGARVREGPQSIYRRALSTTGPAKTSDARTDSSARIDSASASRGVYSANR